MKHLDGSGGSTKGIAINELWRRIKFEKRFAPDIISGVSISALMGVPFAMGRHEELEWLFDHFDNTYIWKNGKTPISNSGGLTCTAVFRAITSKGSFGVMTVGTVLRSLISKEDWEEYTSTDKYPDVIVMAVDFVTGSRVFLNLKKAGSYELFINTVVASASIPVFSLPVEESGKYLYDGGVRNHSIAAKVMSSNAEISETWSIFSRPEDYKEILPNWCPKNVVNVISRTLQIMSIEVSKKDQREQVEVARKSGKVLRQCFTPAVLETLYDTDRGRLNELKNKVSKIDLDTQVVRIN